MSQPWRTAITQRWAVPSSLSLSLYPLDTQHPLVLSGPSLHPQPIHTHITPMIYCHTLLCVVHACVWVNLCAHMWAVCMAGATSNTLKLHSSETLPHPFSFPHSDSNTEKRTFLNFKKLINKSKGRLHLAQCLYLRFPSMCLGRRSGGTEPESAWKQ